MITRFKTAVGYRIFLLLPLGMLLLGCQGIYVHQPDRAATAATAKARMATVDIAALTKTENENIARLTQEEIKSIEARQKLVSSLAVIRLSTGEESIQAHYTHSMEKVSATLGVSSMLSIQSMGNCRINQTARADNVKAYASTLRAYGGSAPACASKGMPALLPAPADLDADSAKDFTDTYGQYKAACEASACPTLDPAGEMAAAEKAREQSRAQQAALKLEVDKARAEYGAAVAANTAKTKAAADKEATVRAKAGQLAESLGKLASISPEAARRVQASALADLLSAAATNATDTKDADHAAALEIAKGLPSLAQAVEVAEAAGEQVPVSHLLLALNNLLIQADRDVKLAALDTEEFTALERKAGSRDRQSALWRQYSDNLCNLAYNANKEPGPGQACGTIQFPAQGKCLITLADNSVKTIDNCVLSRSWRSLFEDGLPAAMPGATAQQVAAARRSLHEAAAAYLQVRLVAYQTTLEEFRRIDVAYRRTVVRREAALLQWKNIVALPAEELDGYYAGGTKPEDVSDLIIKALAVTAVLIGVAK